MALIDYQAVYFKAKGVKVRVEEPANRDHAVVLLASPGISVRRQRDK